MRHRSRSYATLPVAAVLAFALSITASVPGLTTGPLGNEPVVRSAGAVTYTRVASLGKATVATNISMPRIGINMRVTEGKLGATLISKYWAFHYPSTSWPGGRSNTYIYAHAQTGAFLNLKYARVGDLLTFRLITGQYVKYKVATAYSVAWNDTRWLKLTTSERITLQTCLGNTATARRFVVTAVPAY